MRLIALALVGIALFAPARGATGTALPILGFRQGPRQAALGGAGVAVVDRGRAARFNPALPGLGFARDRRAIEWHPAWQDYPSFMEMRLKDWNGPAVPVAPDLGPMYGSLFFRWPGLYVPRWGYLAYDRQTFDISDFDFREEAQSITISLAEDFLETGPSRPEGWGWTGGLTAKLWDSRLTGATQEGDPFSIEAKGLALDLGWAARGPGPAFLPRTWFCLGAAFFNLGNDVVYEGGPDGAVPGADPLPMEYRLGASGTWAPFPALTVRSRAVEPLRALATVEAGKEFANRDSRGAPLNPAASFIREFSVFRDFPGGYLRDMSTHAGAEATAFGIASLRYGRMGTRQSDGDKDYWFYGWGLDTGPWLKYFEARFDYARQLSTHHDGGGMVPFRQYGFDLEAWF
jgi:hypothetical protein